MDVMSLVVLFFLPASFAQNKLVQGCLQIENMLECSNSRFRHLPSFTEWTKLSTLQLFIRNNPHLNLSEADFDEWPNLFEIHLHSKYIFFL